MRELEERNYNLTSQIDGKLNFFSSCINYYRFSNRTEHEKQLQRSL